MSHKNSPARGSTRTEYGTKTVYSRTIALPPAEVYRQLRDVGQLVTIVRDTPRKISQEGNRLEILSGDGECHIVGTIINEQEGSLLAWESTPESDFAHAGTIRLDAAPGDEGAEVTVTLEYEQASGSAKLSEEALAGPGKVVADTLRRFKAWVEAGEIPTIQGQSVGEPQRSKGVK